jgi:hypothetical protein
MDLCTIYTNNRLELFHDAASTAKVVIQQNEMGRWLLMERRKGLGRGQL